jgi:hypothetical protein
MKREIRISLFLILSIFISSILSTSIILASSIDNEMQKITHYAEEYETGNIDYIRLMLYLSSAREGLNEILGASGREMGGIVKEDKLIEVLGEPQEKTKWVWVEGEEQDKKLDEAVPVWKKIVFDGKKIQIRIGAYPSIFKKQQFEDGLKNKNFEAQEIEEGAIIYRLHFDIEFKKPEEQINIKSKIDEIQALAQSSTSMETLAKESVNAEMIFNNYFRQGGGKCEDIMKGVFGSENQRQTQQILLQEIEFCEGDNFEGILRLEMCDECEWNYINMNFHIEGRGPGFKPLDDFKNAGFDSRESYKNLDSSSFMTQTTELIEEIQRLCQSGDHGQAMASSQKLRMLTDAWNQKSNDVWQQIEQEKIKQEPEENEDPYWWIKQDQLQRQKAEDLRKNNYESRKSFYLGLFSRYNKQEYFFEQTDFEKRLIEEFRERGEEICDNNQDDNDNKQIDCSDSQCGGKICGKGSEFVESGNQTIAKEINLYCISGSCQAKEEEKGEEPVCGNNFCEEGERTCSSSTIVCGEDETECAATADCKPVYCPEDCLECPIYDIISCDGNLVKGGIDKTGCELPSVCVNETISCIIDENCGGCGECIKGECQLKQWIIGKEEKECNLCEDGEKIIEECPNGEEITNAFCMAGIWVYPDIWCKGVIEEVCCSYSGPADEQLYEWRNKDNCESPESSEFSEQIVSESYCKKEKPKENCEKFCWDDMSNKMPECPGDLKISGNYPDCSCEWKCEEIVDNECMVANDCGGENDVCSNGKCESIHEKIEIKTPESGELSTTTQIPEPEEEQESIPEPELEPEPEITGNIIFGFFQTLINKFKGPQMTITGYAVDENNEEVSSEPEPAPEPKDSEELGTENPFDNSGGDPGPGPEPDNNCADKYKACGGPCPPCDYDKGLGDGGDYKGEDNYDNSGEYDEKNKKENEQNKEEQKQRCQEECARMTCGIEKCIREACGDEMNCNIDEISKNCEKGCVADEGCVNKCMEGGNWWQEFQQKDEHKEEKGVFQVGGGCRKEQGKTEGYIWFGGWGEPYEQLEPLKQKYYKFGGSEDWCQQEIDNLIKQRQEFEKGFNQEFAVWFFEKYLPNSAEEWEAAQSGIFELYWNNVDTQMRLSNTMQCLKKSDVTKIMNINLINIEYETEYGKLEYWEELKAINIPGIEGEITVVSPYMRVWIFPSKEFIKYEMKKGMENKELPGSPEEKMERKNQGGLTEEQKQEVRNDEKAMERIREAVENYGGSLDFVIQFKDYETNEIVFNMYAKINEKVIMEITPILPSEVEQKDATVEMDFALLYDMIYTMEKDTMGDRLESPPWDRKMRPIQKIKDAGNGIKMWNKMRKLKNSAIITPKGSEKELEKFAEWVIENAMGKGPGGQEKDMEIKENEKGNEGEEIKKGKRPDSFNEGISGKATWIS